MSQSNPTSSSGVKAHGSSCNRPMSVQASHIGRKHRACAPKDKTRKQGTCVITGGEPQAG